MLRTAMPPLTQRRSRNTSPRSITLSLDCVCANGQRRREEERERDEVRENTLHDSTKLLDGQTWMIRPKRILGESKDPSLPSITSHYSTPHSHCFLQSKYIAHTHCHTGKPGKVIVKRASSDSTTGITTSILTQTGLPKRWENVERGLTYSIHV